MQINTRVSVVTLAMAAVLVACSSAGTEPGQTPPSTSAAAAWSRAWGGPQCPPPTRKVAVVDELHGDRIVDPYRWLEKDDDEPAVATWTRAQNRCANAVLDAFGGRTKIRKRIEELLMIDSISVPAVRRDLLLYGRRRGVQNQPVLFKRRGLGGQEEAILDINSFSTDGTTSMDWSYLSPGGRYLAFGLSEGGTELSVLRLLDVHRKELLPDRIPNCRSAAVGWLPDESGFYYTRYPSRDEVPKGDDKYYRTIHFHRLGDPWQKDQRIYRPPASKKTYWTSLNISRDGRWLTVMLMKGWSVTQLYLADLTKQPITLKPVVENVPANFHGYVNRNTLYVLTNYKAPNYRLMAADVRRPAMANWRELVSEEADAVLRDFSLARGHVALLYNHKASSKLRLVDRRGRGAVTIPLPGLGSIGGLRSEPDGTHVFYGFTGYGVPRQIHVLDVTTRQSQLWQAVAAKGIDPQAVVTKQVTYPSRDGTPITMFLVHRRDLVRDGRNPTVLYGYGGFNVPITPGFSANVYFWVERGGVYAIPNLRGGGEYGEKWHQAGMLDQKQNVFDDFIAAAEWLVTHRYTRSDRLGIVGGSNGGLLTGAFVTQRPKLCRAALLAVPLLDMLRYHKFLIAKLWIPEYGSADVKEQYAYLRRYSPYHKVKEGTRYPAVLLTTAEGDSRVHPLHARKMTALLQAAQGGPLPIILKTEVKAGHGKGKPLSKKINELTDRWTFFSMLLRR